VRRAARHKGTINITGLSSMAIGLLAVEWQGNGEPPYPSPMGTLPAKVPQGLSFQGISKISGRVRNIGRDAMRWLDSGARSCAALVGAATGPAARSHPAPPDLSRGAASPHDPHRVSQPAEHTDSDSGIGSPGSASPDAAGWAAATDPDRLRSLDVIGLKDLMASLVSHASLVPDDDRAVMLGHLCVVLDVLQRRIKERIEPIRELRASADAHGELAASAGDLLDKLVLSRQAATRQARAAADTPSGIAGRVHQVWSKVQPYLPYQPGPDDEIDAADKAFNVYSDRMDLAVSHDDALKTSLKDPEWLHHAVKGARQLCDLVRGSGSASGDAPARFEVLHVSMRDLIRADGPWSALEILSSKKARLEFKWAPLTGRALELNHQRVLSEAWDHVFSRSRMSDDALHRVWQAVHDVAHCDLLVSLGDTKRAERNELRVFLKRRIEAERAQRYREAPVLRLSACVSEIDARLRSGDDAARVVSDAGKVLQREVLHPIARMMIESGPPNGSRLGYVAHLLEAQEFYPPPVDGFGEALHSKLPKKLRKAIRDSAQPGLDGPELRLFDDMLTVLKKRHDPAYAANTAQAPEFDWSKLGSGIPMTPPGWLPRLLDFIRPWNSAARIRRLERRMVTLARDLTLLVARPEPRPRDEVRLKRTLKRLDRTVDRLQAAYARTQRQGAARLAHARLHDALLGVFGELSGDTLRDLNGNLERLDTIGTARVRDAFTLRTKREPVVRRQCQQLAELAWHIDQNFNKDYRSIRDVVCRMIQLDAMDRSNDAIRSDILAEIWKRVDAGPRDKLLQRLDKYSSHNGSDMMDFIKLEIMAGMPEYHWMVRQWLENLYEAGRAVFPRQGIGESASGAWAGDGEPDKTAPAAATRLTLPAGAVGRALLNMQRALP
jgi:hypothetical protein